ncbi:MAG: GGDEF domain-containing protein, partial [Candidatus Omnitrophica bacterium]|nr:GGDEF domain-containing protein [Candidatus Omnitrophota bacterium]
ETEKLGFSLPRRVETVLAIPLFTEGEIKSIVIAENVRPEDFEKFAIVIGQFALEMHKVKLYELVEKLAITDGLTGLSLKRHFLESLKKEIKRSSSNRLKIAILMLDIDHFKKYNDRYGHLVGDSVLVRISEIIRDHTREIDLISRYGGEEFCLALPETDKEGAYAVAERIRVEVERENFMAEGEFTRATISIGIACFPDDGREAVQLIDMSDQALYEAKNSGRNSSCIYKRSA